MQSSEQTPVTSLRLLHLGDTWGYKVAGTLTPPGAEPLALTGQITVSIVPDRLLGRSEAMTILFSQKFQVAQPDGSKQEMPAPEWMFSFVQDVTSRDLSIAADNMTPGGAARIAKSPQVFYPGSWSAETRYKNRLDFDNGDHVDNTLTVFGQERVETELGSFLAWKSRISSESAATGLIEGMDWWTPELGAPAKFSTASKMPDGSEMRFVATLSSSSVQLP
jgi:hypothetical protein